MEVINAMGLKAGKKAEYNRMGSIHSLYSLFQELKKMRSGLRGILIGWNGRG